MINFVFPKQILVQHIVTITCLILKIKVFLVILLRNEYNSYFDKKDCHILYNFL